VQKQKPCENCDDRTPGPRYIRAGGHEKAIRLCQDCENEDRRLDELFAEKDRNKGK
jgi:hypothetical protein